MNCSKWIWHGEKNCPRLIVNEVSVMNNPLICVYCNAFIRLNLMFFFCSIYIVVFNLSLLLYFYRCWWCYQTSLAPSTFLFWTRDQFDQTAFFFCCALIFLFPFIYFYSSWIPKSIVFMRLHVFCCWTRWSCIVIFVELKIVFSVTYWRLILQSSVFSCGFRVSSHQFDTQCYSTQ